MNRIILIGNGFDLAHGMKTSYRDFIDDYWIKLRKKCKTFIERKYEDDEISIGWVPKHWVEGEGYCFLRQASKDYRFKIQYKNSLIPLLSNKTYKTGWVDVEEEYYRLLKEAYRIDTKINNKIETLNKNFASIKNLLEKYLTTIEEEFDSSYKTNTKLLHRKAYIQGEVYGSFDRKDFNEVTRSTWETLKNGKIEKIYPSQVLFLNFNYTNTHEFYIPSKKNSKIPTHSIYIHGKLNDKNNKLIFGFGDELDEDYKEIENLNDNRYLENIKSIRYLESNSYKEMLNFINSDHYQIFIFGHSCGNSDRTLLNTLFEHENCSSIKPYFRQRNDGSDNYSEIVRNISRSFKDKQIMRDRVVNKTYCSPLFS